MKKIYLNTIISLGESLTQQEFSDFLAQSQLEIDGIEYRYEMFAQDTATRSQEFLQFLETGKLKNWDVLLSIPSPLFTAEGLTPDFDTYLQAASQLGAQRIKMNVGELSGITKVDVEEFTALLQEYHLKVNIENDQTEANGRLSFIKEALETITDHGLPIGYTFDAGNFTVMGDDADQAYRLLKAHATVVHVKNVNQDLGNSLLDDGIIPWRSQLDLEVPHVLEYPMSLSELETELKLFREAF